MLLDLITELGAMLRLRRAQVAHLGDGRRYALEVKVGEQWLAVGEADSTYLADTATRWLLERGHRPRALFRGRVA